MDFHATVRDFMPNGGNPRQVSPQLGPLFYTCSWDSSCGKLCEYRDSVILEIRQLGGQPVEIAGGRRPLDSAVIQEIGVGDDRRLALADSAARDQAVSLDRAPSGKPARRRE